MAYPKISAVSGSIRTVATYSGTALRPSILRIEIDVMAVEQPYTSP